jgi:hypothetical protein
MQRGRTTAADRPPQDAVDSTRGVLALRLPPIGGSRLQTHHTFDQGLAVAIAPALLTARR